VLLNGTAMFNHANARLPQASTSCCGWIVVTRTCIVCTTRLSTTETNSNFGFNLPWWDRIFGTYRARPAAGHQAMTIGVDAFRTREDLRLDRLLVQPFRESAGGYCHQPSGILRRPNSVIPLLPVRSMMDLGIAGSRPIDWCGRIVRPRGSTEVGGVVH